MNDNYEEVAKIKTRYSYSAFTVLNGKLYLTGGRQNPADPERYIRFISEVLAFSPFDKNFTLVASMNYSRAFHGCCSHADSVFVCGGKDGDSSTCCENLTLKITNGSLSLK